MTVSGAYGFRLSGLASGAWLGVSGAIRWPEVSCKLDDDPNAPEVWLDAHALELRVRADVQHSEFVHPLLGRAASQLALAHGADGMHAGAIAGRAGAWAVIGPKGAGKSTLLAGLNDIGVPIVTDDILVLRDGMVMAGPRCIDLRPDVQRFGVGLAVRPSHPRNRVGLPSIPAEHRLVGLIHLEWSSGEASGETTIEALGRRGAIRRLLVLRTEKGYPRNPQALLDLAMLPTVVLSRPRVMSGLDDAVAQVERLLFESESGRAYAGSRVSSCHGS